MAETPKLDAGIVSAKTASPKEPAVEPKSEPQIEAWMRGPLDGVSPLLAPTLYSFQQAREDLAKWTDGLTLEQIWDTPHGFGSVGFHVRHIAGSTERLMAYLQGEQLSPAQLAALKAEKQAGATRAELLAQVEQAFLEAETVIKGLNVTQLTEPRGIGRKQLPTTVAGLLVHIAEHTQRHVGQAISAAKWSRVTRSEKESPA